MLSIRMPLSSGAYFYLFSIWTWIPVSVSGIRGYCDTAIQVGVFEISELDENIISDWNLK